MDNERCLWATGSLSICNQLFSAVHSSTCSSIFIRNRTILIYLFKIFTIIHLCFFLFLFIRCALFLPYICLILNNTLYPLLPLFMCRVLFFLMLSLFSLRPCQLPLLLPLPPPLPWQHSLTLIAKSIWRVCSSTPWSSKDYQQIPSKGLKNSVSCSQDSIACMENTMRIIG